jgi:CRP/FNR family transcriptional regulator
MFCSFEVGIEIVRGEKDMQGLAKTEKKLRNCDQCLVRHRALCSAAGTDAVAELNRIAHIRSFPAGSTIISAGDRVPFVGNVLSGVVKLTRVMADGRLQIVGLLFASDFVGRAFGEHWSFSAEAATDVELCTFERKAFERLIADFPELEHQLLVATLDELDAARDWMLLLGCKSAEEKIASFLMFIARRAAIGSNCNEPHSDIVEFELPVNRSDMAAYLGTTVETVSRQITRLKTANVIRLTDMHHFVVPDMERLAEIAAIDDLPAED